jgi:glycosyltransferase involved in cell wall biosynthesis
MKFRILEVDLASPPAPVDLGADEYGLALVVRCGGRPVGFVLEDGSPGATVVAERIATLAAGAAAEAVVHEALLESLTPTPLEAKASITIAVCTRDRAHLLARCLDSIAATRASHPTAATSVELLVVDNAPSNDDTKKTVEAHPDARYVMEPRPGLDFARNAAWQAATGDFVAYVDDDAVLDRGWLGGFARAVARNPDAGAVTGLVLPYALETEAQIVFEKRGGWRRGFLPARYLGRDRLGHPYYPVGAGMFGAGCNMVIRRSLLAKLGGFDEALDTGPPLPGGGDLDIFYRVISANVPLVYEPALAVFHEHRREMKALRRQYYTWGLGFHAFLAKVLRDHPEDRRKVSGIRRWWIIYMTQTLLGRQGPAAFVFAEIFGGLVGFCGAYGRSRARIAKIREAHA